MEDIKPLAESLGTLLWHPRSGALIALLAIAATIDLRSSRIPNWLTVGGTLWALAAATAEGGAGGLGSAAGGLAIGLVVLLPMYALRVLGAGDVKLMATVGAFVGAGAVLGAVLYSLVAGGLLAIAWAASQGALRRLAVNLRLIAGSLLMPGGGTRAALLASVPSVGKLPLGLGICLGTLVFLLQSQFG